MASQKTYAKWLLQSDYVPFEDVVNGRQGIQKATAELYMNIRNAPQETVHANEQLKIAADVLADKVASKHWPGKRCEAIMKARAAASKSRKR